MLRSCSLAARSAYNIAGPAASEEADENFDKRMLLVLGVTLKEKGDTNLWSYFLVALLPAIVIYFCANWWVKDPYGTHRLRLPHDARQLR